MADGTDPMNAKVAVDMVMISVASKRIAFAPLRSLPLSITLQENSAQSKEAQSKEMWRWPSDHLRNGKRSPK